MVNQFTIFSDGGKTIIKTCHVSYASVLEHFSLILLCLTEIFILLLMRMFNYRTTLGCWSRTIGSSRSVCTSSGSSGLCSLSWTSTTWSSSLCSPGLTSLCWLLSPRAISSFRTSSKASSGIWIIHLERAKLQIVIYWLF